MAQIGVIVQEDYSEFDYVIYEMIIMAFSQISSSTALT